MHIWPYILLSGLMLAGAVTADESYHEARRLAAEGKIQPLESILKKIQAVRPGEVLEVELEHEGNRVLYEIELLDEQGIVRELKVDAVTGRILDQKREE
jgi:uncharacterized membrane protein YkoI